MSKKITCNQNRIKPTTNVVFNVILAFLAICCIFPVIYVFMISISSSQSIAVNGYKFIPKQFSALQLQGLHCLDLLLLFCL